MNINSIKINGFKAIREISLTPDGKSVEITGGNRRGKTSLMDGIWVALTGKEVPGVAVHREAIRAAVELGLSDGCTVLREWGPKGMKLTVSTADGTAVKAPQTFLDNLVGKISFDPVAFCRETPANQRKFLLDLLKLDTAIPERKKATALELKRDADADVKAIERQMDELVDAVETDPVDVEEALAEQEKHQQAKNLLAAAERDVVAVREAANRNESRREEIAAQIEALRAKLQEIPGNESNVLAIAEAERKVSAAELNLEDAPDISEVIAAAGEVNRQADRWKTRCGLRAKWEEARAASERQAQASKDADAEKDQLIMDCKFPIDGLSFSVDGVLYKGLPFDERNQCLSDIIKVGLAISIAQNPGTKIVRFVADSLDAESRLQVLQILNEHGFQGFIERVTEGPLKALVLEQVEEAPAIESVDTPPALDLGGEG